MATQLRSHARRYICTNNSSFSASRYPYPVGARSFSSISQESAGPRRASGIGGLILCFGAFVWIHDWIDPFGLEATVNGLKQIYCRLGQKSMTDDLKKMQREIDCIKRNRSKRAFMKEGNITREASVANVE